MMHKGKFLRETIFCTQNACSTRNIPRFLGEILFSSQQSIQKRALIIVFYAKKSGSRKQRNQRATLQLHIHLQCGRIPSHVGVDDSWGRVCRHNLFCPAYSHKRYTKYRPAGINCFVQRTAPRGTRSTYWPKNTNESFFWKKNKVH